MEKMLRRLGATFPLFIGFAFAASPELARLQAQIEQLQRDIESERQLLQADRSRSKSWEGASQSQLEEMRAQAKRARTEADSLARLRQALGSPAQSQAAEQKRVKQEAEAFSRKAADLADVVLEKMRRGELPAYVDRKERALKDLSRGLRLGVTPPDKGMAELFDHLSDIIDWGRKVEAEPGNYTTANGRLLEGVYVRAGGFFEAFVSKDGTFGAHRIKGDAGWSWKEAMPAERRENLLRAARMLQAQEEPGFVPLPFGLAAGGE